MVIKLKPYQTARMKAFNILITVILLFSFTACKKESSKAVNEPAWLKQNLLLYYPMDGNTKDSSGNGLDAVPNALQPTSNRKNESGKAMRFSAGPSFMAVNLNNTHFAKDYSISLWAKVDSVPVYPLLFHSNFIGIQYDNILKSVSFNNYGVVDFRAFVNRKEWHNITITRSADSTSFFLNGAFLFTNKHVPNSIPKSGTGIIFGREFSGFNMPYFSYNGELDDFRIYQRALTKEEVKYLYQN